MCSEVGLLILHTCMCSCLCSLTYAFLLLIFWPNSWLITLSCSLITLTTAVHVATSSVALQYNSWRRPTWPKRSVYLTSTTSITNNSPPQPPTPPPPPPPIQFKCVCVCVCVCACVHMGRGVDGYMCVGWWVWVYMCVRQTHMHTHTKCGTIKVPLVLQSFNSKLWFLWVW